MKKLNKVLAILCTGAIAVSGIAAFSACGGGHDHNAHLTYVSDGATQHHGECSEDDYKTEKENHTWGANNKCTKCGEDKPAEVNVTLDKSTASVEVGKAVTINVTVTGSTAAVTATSGTPANATVSVNGKVVTVTGVKAGTSVITVSCGGVSKTCTVTVTAPAEASLSHERAVLEDDGDLKTFEITVKNAEGAVTADTADHEVATAAYASGKVTLTAVGTGKTELTVSVGGKELKCPVEVATYGLKYGVRDSDDGKYIAVADGENRTSTDIYIPGYWEDPDDGLLPVTEIVSKDAANSISGGFEGKTNIASVYLGDNLVKVGDNAFESCFNLETVVSGPALKVIGGGAFSSGGDAMKLHTVDISKATELTDVGGCAFRFTQLTEFTFPATVTGVGYAAFQGCEKLTTVKFLGDITMIYNDTFLNANNIHEVWIPKSVTEIQRWAFGSYAGMPDGGVDLTIKYSGTQQEWAAITISTELNDRIFADKNAQLKFEYEVDFTAA